jgi:hypothetical protein
MADFPTLINLTGKPQFVVSDGTMLHLPEAPPPRVLEMSSTNPPRTLTAQVGEVEIHLNEIDMVGKLFSGPPVIESVLWLVKADAFSQFPDRSDFVRPAAYKLVDLDGLDYSSIDSNVIDKAALVPGRVMVLVNVSRSPLVASAGAARLQDLDVDSTPTTESGTDSNDDPTV